MAAPTQKESEIRLTPVSYIVLGLLEFAGEATPYDLKQLASAPGGVHMIWTVQHAQLYSEPERLAQAGYLSEKREQEGRRRCYYKLTKRGRKALEDWRSIPSDDFMELRDPGLLQLFFGADPGPLAEAQLRVHEAKLDEYKQLVKKGAAGPPGVRSVPECGVGHEREWIRFWSKLADEHGKPKRER